jgi:hypothetical protein
VALGDTAAQGKTDPGSRIPGLIAVQPLKHAEDAFRMNGIDADAIVLDNNHGGISPPFLRSPGFVAQHRFISVYFNGIGKKVLQQSESAN